VGRVQGRRRRLGRPVVGLVAAVLLAGCASSSVPSQAAQGAQGNAGRVAVRNAVLVLGPDGSGSSTVAVTLVNDGGSADALTGVELADDQPWEVYITGGRIALSPGQSVTVGYRGDPHVNLYGYDPSPGRLVAMTFVFRDNGRVVLQVKALPATGPLAGIAPVPSEPPST
jgi:copper(I)-binding protein